MEDFSQYMNPPEKDAKEKTLDQKVTDSGYEPKMCYVSAVTYTGDGSIVLVAFEKEEDAVIECKSDFERSIKDAEENEGFESIIDWDASGHYGAINWCDGEQSRFEVIEAPYVCSKICDEVLTAEFDEERSV